MYRISPYVLYLACALFAGTALATTWVNLDPASYYDFIEWRIADVTLPQWIWSGSVTLTPYMIVADVLMAIFFAIIGKELWEAIALERGALHGLRAILPALITLGGMAGAALGWLWLSARIETAEEAISGGGWAAPLGSDTLLVCLFGVWVFGRRPALHLVLLIAIATDISALLILGLAHVSWGPRLLWLALPLLAIVLLNRVIYSPERAITTERMRRQNQRLLPYVAAGLLSWLGVAASGFPAALGLLPILPAIAHAERSFGLFAEAESLLNDPLNRLIRALIWPALVIVFLFGLIRGGLDFAAIAPTTWVMLGALWLGRPLGMALALFVAWALLRQRLPRGLRKRDLIAALVLLSIGFTVPMVALEAEVPGGAMREAARLGLGISLLAGPLAIALSRLPALARPLWRGGPAPENPDRSKHSN